MFVLVNQNGWLIAIQRGLRETQYPRVPFTTSTDGMKTIRVLSYNIHKGFNANNRQFVLSEMRKAIRSLDADLVFLQEILGEHSAHSSKIQNWPLETQFEYLADEIWHHHAYGKNAVYTDGHHGNAILSKYPISKWENHDISAGPFEKRGLLFAGIETEIKLNCFCTHLALFRRARAFQFKKLCEHIKQMAEPEQAIIIGGDFNDWQGRACGELQRSLGAVEVHKSLNGRLARTFPSKVPIFRLDRIYVKGLEIKSAKVIRGYPWNLLSDHLPILADLTLPESAA